MQFIVFFANAIFPL